MRARLLSDGGLTLENGHDHGDLSLRGSAFDDDFVAHLILLIAAL